MNSLSNDAATNGVRTWLLDSFDDPRFGRAQWNNLLCRGDTNVVYLTWEWVRAWWETQATGQLLLIAAEQEGRIVALAPFYAERKIVFFLGTGESDYMDFIGDIGDPEVLDAILETARRCTPDFEGFKFFAVLECSRTGQRLKDAADRLGLEIYIKETWPAPIVDLVGKSEYTQAATNKKFLLKRERFFRHRGLLELRQFRDGNAILPHLDGFFAQHVARWASGAAPSPFVEPEQRAFYERLTRLAAHTGWLRLSRLDWDGRPIAFEYGWCYGGTYFGGPSCFAVDLARRSPGQVLLRNLILNAIDEGVQCYDFGTGDEPYKFHFATHLRHVHSWGLTPPM